MSTREEWQIVVEWTFGEVTTLGTYTSYAAMRERRERVWLNPLIRSLEVHHVVPGEEPEVIDTWKRKES